MKCCNYEYEHYGMGNNVCTFEKNVFKTLIKIMLKRQRLSGLELNEEGPYVLIYDLKCTSFYVVKITLYFVMQ